MASFQTERATETLGEDRGGHPENVLAGFRDAAARFPTDTAIGYGKLRKSYAELDRETDGLAWRLVGAGVRVTDVICVAVTREEYPAALLASCKAGATFLPMDAEMPLERLVACATTTGSRHVLASRRVGELASALAERLDNANVHWLDTSPDAPSSRQPLPWHDVGGLDPCYIVFTSGSTGAPKGAAMHHGSQVPLLRSCAERYRERPRALQFFSPSSDVATFEILSAWWSAGAVVVAEDRARRDSRRLAEDVETAAIDKLTLPVGALDALAQAVAQSHVPIRTVSGLREVITTGEPQVISPEIRELFANLPDCELHDQYGATEVNVVSAPRRSGPPTSWPVRPPIGRPVPGAALYVLDERLRMCPVGVYGELHVGGYAVGLGYVGQSRLTAERFLPDGISGRSGARLYRTGDIARWLPTGVLELKGRHDDEVKVRGYRVALGEVELALRAAGRFDRVAVKATGEGAATQLVGYVVDNGVEPDEHRVKEALRKLLPEYMVPSRIVPLPELPVTATGKVDRRALPDPPIRAEETATPRSPAEQAMARIWSEVLGVEGVGREDHFFELGGHSLLVMQVVFRLEEECGLRLDITSVFESPVLADLAQRVEPIATATPPPVGHADRPSSTSPLSLMQTSFWYTEQTSDGATTYNNALALRMCGPLDLARLRQATTALVARHPMLRAGIVLDDHGELVQVVEPDAPGPHTVLEVLAYPDFAASPSALTRAIESLMSAPFDLTGGEQLSRFHLLRVASDEHILVVCVHHTISDARSSEVLADDLRALYEGETPLDADAPQSNDFLRYVKEERDRLETGAWSDDLRYWRTRLTHLVGKHRRHRPGRRRAGSIALLVPEITSRRLAAVAREREATEFMCLLTAMIAALGDLDRDCDTITVGVPVDMRHGSRYDRTVGCFINTIPIVADPRTQPSVTALLDQVKARTIEALDHHRVPFPLVMRLLPPERQLVDDMFQLQYADDPTIWQDLTVTDYPLNPGKPKYRTSLSIVKSGGGLSGVLHFDASLLERSQAEELVRAFERAAGELATLSVNHDSPAGLARECGWSARG